MKWLGLLLALVWTSIMQADTIAMPDGLFSSSGLDAHFIAQFALFVACMLGGVLIIGKICKYFLRLPVIAGQIIGGVLLGPTALNIRQLPIFTHSAEFMDEATGQLFSFVSSDFFVLFILVVSATITVAYLLWSAGYETNLQSLAKVGLVATNAGILGAVIPIGVIGGLMYFLAGSTLSLGQQIGIGIIFSATSVSIPVAMLFASHKMHLRSSQATLGAAIIDDVIAVVLLSVFLMVLQAGLLGELPAGYSLPESSLGLALGRMVFAFIALFLVGYFVMPHVIKRLHNMHFAHLIGPTAIIFMLLFFSASELLGGLAGITGAYFAGLFHQMSDTRHHAEKMMSPFVNSLLLPLFLGSIGLQVDLKILSFASWMVVFWILIAAVISKLLATYGALWINNYVISQGGAKWTWLEGYIFGSSMVPRGEVGLVVASILRSSGVIGPQYYVISVVAIVLTTIISPIMLSVGFNYMEKEEKTSDEDMITLNLGMFPTIGTNQLFNMIVNVLTADKKFSSAIRFSEGRRIVNLKKYNVKIAYSPGEGVIMEGRKDQIDQIIALFKKEVEEDIAKIPVA